MISMEILWCVDTFCFICINTSAEAWMAFILYYIILYKTENNSIIIAKIAS